MVPICAVGLWLNVVSSIGRKDDVIVLSTGKPSTSERYSIF